MSEMGDNKTGERERITVISKYLLLQKQIFNISHFTISS